MKGYCYLISEQRTNRYKIGRSKHPTIRLKQLQTGNNNKLAIVCTIKTQNMKATENQLHHLYEHKKARIDDRGEWFLLSFEDVADIKSLPGAW